MYTAVLTYTTINSKHSSGHLLTDGILPGNKTKDVFENMLQEISQRANLPVECIAATSFNILPATVGGNDIEEDV